MTQLIGHFIAGQPEAGTGRRTGPVFNPSTGQEIARCDYADRATLDRAVDVATQAGKRWGRASHAARQAVIFKLRELMIANLELLAEVIGREHGKTIADAKGRTGSRHRRHRICRERAPCDQGRIRHQRGRRY